MRISFWMLLVLVLSSAVLGCGSSPTAPTSSAEMALTARVQDAMAAAIVDEYRAETTYQGVLRDFGDALPFLNVLTAEQRHSASIAGLFTSHGMAVPGNPWTEATVPHFASLPQACAGGVAAERSNIAIYDRSLDLALPGDVRRVFENNRSASLVNHLPAFERCS